MISRNDPMRSSQPSTPEVAALADTVHRVRGGLLPKMRDQRSVTRRMLDALEEQLAAAPPVRLSDSRG